MVLRRPWCQGATHGITSEQAPRSGSATGSTTFDYRSGCHITGYVATVRPPSELVLAPSCNCRASKSLATIKVIVIGLSPAEMVDCSVGAGETIGRLEARHANQRQHEWLLEAIFGSFCFHVVVGLSLRLTSDAPLVDAEPGASRQTSRMYQRKLDEAGGSPRSAAWASAPDGERATQLLSYSATKVFPRAW